MKVAFSFFGFYENFFEKKQPEHISVRAPIGYTKIILSLLLAELVLW